MFQWKIVDSRFTKFVRHYQQNLGRLRTDTRLVFCYRKFMRTDIFFIRTTKPLCNFVNPEITIFVHTIGEDISYSNSRNCIGSVMVSVLAPSAVDRGFEPRSGQTKDYKIGIYCFSTKHIALRRSSKDWLPRNQDNVSEWGRLLLQSASTIKIQQSVLV